MTNGAKGLCRIGRGMGISSPKITTTNLNNCIMARRETTTLFLREVAWDSGPLGYMAAVFKIRFIHDCMSVGSGDSALGGVFQPTIRIKDQMTNNFLAIDCYI